MRQRLLLTALCALVSVGSTQNAQPIVQLNCGAAYTGRWDAVKPSIAVFKGLPFAEPPLAAKRFMPAAPYNCTAAGSKPVPAADEPNACMQVYPPQSSSALNSMPPPPKPNNISEDCLYLNIWGPMPQPKKEPLPIVFWIYGGSNVVGDTIFYRGLDHLPRIVDACLVAPNYRVNVFGWTALQELAAADPRGVAGNYGITDLLVALRWVQDNAAAFGCDPSRVVIYGQSSGGTNIFALLASQAARGLFHGAISLSGSPNLTSDATFINAKQRPIIENTACRGKTGEDLAQCFRLQLSAEELLSAMPDSWNYDGSAPTADPTGFLNYVPLVYIDGVTVSKPLMTALEEGLVDVPLYISTVRNEMDIFPNATVGDWTWEDLQRNYFNSTFQRYPAGTQDLLNELYGPNTHHTSSPAQAYYDFLADVSVACGNHQVGIAAANGFASPVYLVEYDVPLTYPAKSSDDIQFPCHILDWAVANNASLEILGIIPGTAEQAAGALIRHVMTDFLSTSSGSSILAAVPKHTLAPPVNVLNATANGHLAAFFNIPGYKSELCAELASHGFDSRFWWIN